MREVTCIGNNFARQEGVRTPGLSVFHGDWKGMSRIIQGISEGFRYGVRTLLLCTRYSAAAVPVPGLGIGANTAIFTLPQPSANDLGHEI